MSSTSQLTVFDLNLQDNQTCNLEGIAQIPLTQPTSIITIMKIYVVFSMNWNLLVLEKQEV